MDKAKDDAYLEHSTVLYKMMKFLRDDDPDDN